MIQRIILERSGHTWIAHPEGHDCLSDQGQTEHGESDHPTAAVRALLKSAPDLLS